VKLFFASVALILPGMIACADQAAATVITITETGTVVDGVDDGAQFGAAFADLAGQISRSHTSSIPIRRCWKAAIPPV
jgi:hypothetical protein